MKKIIARGAEAILYLDGNILVKERIKKGYRLLELDRKIRSFRTKHEERLLDRARRAGVATPIISETGDFKIKMDYIKGQRIKDVLNKMEKNKRLEIYKIIGESVAKLHVAGIIHGDLTTSNLILKNNKIFFIDFGLGKMSNRIEDQAVDLFLLYEALKSTHFKILDEAWERVLKAYKQNYTKAEEVFNRIEKIKKRRRYKG